MKTSLPNQIIKTGQYYPKTEEEREALRRAYREYTPVGEIDGVPFYVTRIESIFHGEEADEVFTIIATYPAPPIHRFP